MKSFMENQGIVYDLIANIQTIKNNNKLLKFNLKKKATYKKDINEINKKKYSFSKIK